MQQNAALFIMGLTSILVQTTALRKLLTVFSGNELDIGITLAVWLLAVGLGSSYGRRHGTIHSFACSLFAVALLAQPTLLLIDNIRPIFGMIVGETIPLPLTIASTILSLTPVCFAIGAQFPLSVGYLNGNAARAYSLEAAGAFFGGVLFTFILAGRVDAYTLAAIVSILNIMVMTLLQGSKRGLALLLIPILFHVGATRIVSTHAGQDRNLVKRIETRYGELALYESQRQANVFYSGRFAFSYPDMQTEELKAHVPMSLHPSPARVLLVGGSPAVARELLKYPVDEVVFLELDPGMIDLSFGILSRDDRDRLKDPRLKVLARDARSFIKTTLLRFDLVILNLPEPASAGLNRLYTEEFFRETKAIMGESGILCLNLPASHAYIGRRMQAANGSVYATLKTAFPHAALSSEEYGGMYASTSPINTSPREIAARFEARHLQTIHFNSFLFHDIFDPLKQAMVRSRLSQSATINTDRRPAAYLYNLMLWSEMHGGGFLNIFFGLNKGTILALSGAALLAGMVLFRKKEHRANYSLITTGYTAMSFIVILLLSYQASFGYLFAAIGLLTALFMAGSAAGAYFAPFLNGSVSWVPVMDLLLLFLFLCTPLFLGVEILYYVLLLVCGILSGAQFAVVNRVVDSAGGGEQAGSLYALELGGSVLGALATTLFLVPVLGIGSAVLSLVLMKGSSLLLQLRRS